MTELDQLKMFLTLMVGHLPVLVASIVALAVVAARRQRAPEAARWALLGFGIALFLAVEIPAGQVMIQAWIVRSFRSVSQSQWIFGVYGIGNSLLGAASLIFLLLAVLAGRPRSDVPPPFPGA